jgi:hypothetical protein
MYPHGRIDIPPHRSSPASLETTAAEFSMPASSHTGNSSFILYDAIFFVRHYRQPLAPF